MKPLKLMNFAEGHWVEASGGPEAYSAVTGEPVASTGSRGLDFGAMAKHARDVGGPALRKLTFHDRARILKALGQAVNERKEELYDLAYETGCTRGDNWGDIEGGAMTLFSYSSKGRRELPPERIFADGPPEMLSKGGTFIGQHVFTPLQGVAIHINAFNFPVWGMLEKLAPTLLAGVPAIVKPATATSYVTERCFRILMDTGVLPEGALQLIVGSVGDLLDHLTPQDVVSFTGSAGTAMKLQSNPVIARQSVRFIAERDSLNATMLGPDAAPGTPEFDLFVKEVVREMTTKAGQKCTCIRRAFVPERVIDAAQEAITARLSKIVVGDPRAEPVRMGALVSQDQRKDVREKVGMISREARIVFGDLDQVQVHGADADKGAFISPILMRCDEPRDALLVHETEAFGPVATLMPYRDLDEGVGLCNKGEGSLVMSLFTHDPAVATDVVMGAGAWHGRVLIVDRDCAKESTGHGNPLPTLIHGGPGRAGGGEEMGGIRGVTHYMQRTALQGSPRTLSAVVNRWLPGGEQITGERHPFRLRLSELEIGYTIVTEPRLVTLEDIEHFAEFTGDTFYAHMDEEAAAANPFFPGRVAHGYLLLSFAAGLFVDPAPGPVLANYGLDNLRFLKPVSPGDSMKVRLTAKSKAVRNEEYGEVRWDVLITNQDDEAVATYDLLTMNAL
jgi:oxepin-CoA hydrolase / 3-oxo-5,6-dehydrosuberyl-CoA semialdehyde dehydrogenase